jgi:glycosyltransferase
VKISIITVVRNSEKTIGHAVESVLSQSHSDIELLIQDGASSDNTLNILRKLNDPRLHIVTESDSGIYDAINRGVERSKGDVIGLMHSDDFFAHEHVLENVVERFTNNSIDGVYGDLNYVAPEQTKRVIRAWRAGEYNPDKIFKGWMPPHPTLYLRRSVFEQWGRYDTSFRIAADYDAMLRWITKGNIQLSYLPQVMVCMRVGGVSNRSLMHLLKKSQEDYRALQQNNVGGLYTLALKNLSKITQFWKREKEQL